MLESLIATTPPAPLTPLLVMLGIAALVMLLWDTIEVGRNDAANLVNAVFGARVLTRRPASAWCSVRRSLLR